MIPSAIILDLAGSGNPNDCCVTISDKLFVFRYRSQWLVDKVSQKQPCDVIKMRKMKGEVGKKPPKKEMVNHSFL